MKVFISADMEGVNGITRWKDTEPGADYEAFRRQMTREVNGAIEGAIRAGADYVLVKDAHDNGLNIIPDLLHEEGYLFRGSSKTTDVMMAGLDESFDAVLFVGYHSAAGTNFNPLSHTMSTSIVHAKLNGSITSEFDLNAMMASELKIPVAFLSGDDGLCRYSKLLIKDLETVSSSIGHGAGVLSPNPHKTIQAIEDGVYNALTKDYKSQLMPLSKSYEFEVKFKEHGQARRASFYPNTDQLDAYTVLFKGKTIKDVMAFLMFTVF